MPPASVSLREHSRYRLGPGPQTTTRLRAARSWRVLRSQPLRRRSPVAALSSASRVCEVTSDVLVAPASQPPLEAEAASDRSCVRQTRFRRRLVKDDDFPGTGRLPSTSAPSFSCTRPRPLARSASFARELVESPPPFTRFCHRGPASGARSPLLGGGARPHALGGGPGAARRLLQSIQSASTTARSSDPRCARPPASFAKPALEGGPHARDLLETMSGSGRPTAA